MKKYLLSVCFISLFLAGCSPIEFYRKIVGTSVQELDRARAEGFSRTYTCSFDQCFDAILTLDRKLEKDPNKDQRENFVVYIQSRIRGYIVVMGIQGQVDTTEVAIFMENIDDKTQRIDISSLSTTAKEKVAFLVFSKLDELFPQPSSRESNP
jgi:hypothetical protein